MKRNEHDPRERETRKCKGEQVWRSKRCSGNHMELECWEVKLEAGMIGDEAEGKTRARGQGPVVVVKCLDYSLGSIQIFLLW